MKKTQQMVKVVLGEDVGKKGIVKKCSKDKYLYEVLLDNDNQRKEYALYQLEFLNELEELIGSNLSNVCI